MTDKLASSLVGLFGGLTTIAFGKEIVIFIISMIPILELRGGLIAASLLDVNPIVSFFVCFLGNIIPIPLILWFITPIFTKLKRGKLFKRMVEKLESKALSKKEKIEKYEFWGLLLFIGIPLPGTGAWTGCLIAAMLDMDKKKSFLAAILGVFLAGIIMMFVSFGFLKGIIN